MEETKELVALGEEAKRFASGNLGRYIFNAAEMEIEDALYALAVVDSEDTKKIQELQNRIKIHSIFKRWIEDAIEAGDLAYSDYLTEAE